MCACAHTRRDSSSPENKQWLDHEFSAGGRTRANECASVSRREIAELRGELDEERGKRIALQVPSIFTATHAGLSTFISLISSAKY